MIEPVDHPELIRVAGRALVRLRARGAVIEALVCTRKHEEEQ